MIKLVLGDVTNRVTNDHGVIIHCCNDIGVMGSGVALAIKSKWFNVGRAYSNWFKNGEKLKQVIYQDVSPQLGNIQLVEGDTNTIICNLIGQKGIGFQKIGSVSLAPVRLEALYEGFLKVRNWLENQPENGRFSLHLPKLGSDLAGGKFYQVFKQYNRVFGSFKLDTYFYAFSEKDYHEMFAIINNNKSEIYEPLWTTKL